MTATSDTTTAPITKVEPSKETTVSVDVHSSNTRNRNHNRNRVQVAFSHVHVYADQVEALAVYKQLENHLNQFELDQQKVQKQRKMSLPEQQALWQSILLCHEGSGAHSPTPAPASSFMEQQNPQPIPFVSHGRDLVKQLLAGVGYRVTAASNDHHTQIDTGTRTVLVTSPDPHGVQILITSSTTAAETSTAATAAGSPSSTANINCVDSDDYYFLEDARVQAFYAVHAHRPGIAVLGFQVNDVDRLYANYQAQHPRLIAHYYNYNSSPSSCNENDATSSSSSPCKILEVFAYYNQTTSTDTTTGLDEDDDKTPDRGTRLRFVQVQPQPSSSSSSSSSSSGTEMLPIPGLVPVNATFPISTSSSSASSSSAFFQGAAYWDHWVSNVWSRTDFIRTLHDTLDFVPKVDFNAGVVAAGEAQIESTVTGNTQNHHHENHDNDDKNNDQEEEAATMIQRLGALRDPRQVYLPINNALSPVGHVHGFLQELGQGIQHVASRVHDLVSFVQAANDRRRIFQEGFTFLNIPRSYYGVVDPPPPMHHPIISRFEWNGIIFHHERTAVWVWETLLSQGYILPDGAVVDLERPALILADQMHKSLQQAFLDAQKNNHEDTIAEVEDMYADYLNQKDALLQKVCHSRYRNVYTLLQDHSVSEVTFLGIVRNQILVDIQGEDVLYQIFTSNVLQRAPGDEAPFFEFIQRVCGCPATSTTNTTSSRKKRNMIRPGCGGFGIRNFLTLFLSIELSQATQDLLHARDHHHHNNDNDRASSEVVYAQTRIQYLTAQLSESSPILTQIADAMTDEGACQDALEQYQQQQQLNANLESNDLVLETLMQQLQMARSRKEAGNAALMECSARYNALMKALREEHQQPVQVHQLQQPQEPQEPQEPPQEQVNQLQTVQ